MAQRGHVPQFGDWNQNTAYTTYFETARKGKSSGANIINPNDPEQMAELHKPAPMASPEPQYPRQGHRGPPDYNAVNQQPRSNYGREERDYNAANQQPRSNYGREERDYDAANQQPRPNYGRGEREREGFLQTQPPQPRQRPNMDHQNRHHGGNRRSVGEAGYFPSPSPVAQGRAANARQGPHGRQRPATVPKFGEWDAADPKSSAGYTVIFNQVKEDKKAAAATQFPQVEAEPVPSAAMQRPYHHHHDSFWGGVSIMLFKFHLHILNSSESLYHLSSNET
ncbi:hypothetical protein Cni_G03812 [Canna indica]|uniref:RIN4 pathogenic type III effector avirulence factor Avr cleavage site domain-containing protein n=1 Tax=Canna indica TaxID=4628 RepID=A0AAQ3JVG7_9LILI|nr:hypothetical protein Cni_G03812 [Canna indica]